MTEHEVKARLLFARETGRSWILKDIPKGFVINDFKEKINPTKLTKKQIAENKRILKESFKKHKIFRTWYKYILKLKENGINLVL